MTFASATSIASILLCIAVLVQSVRLMRALEAVKGGGLGQIVGSVDTATAEARRVLGQLTALLRGDLSMTAQTLQQGKAMVEELTVMTGIADAIAERIVAVAGASNRDAVAMVVDVIEGGAMNAPVVKAVLARPAPLDKPEPVRAVSNPPKMKRAHPAQAAAAKAEAGGVALPVRPVQAQRKVSVRAELPPATIIVANRAGAHTSRRLRARMEADQALRNDTASSGAAA